MLISINFLLRFILIGLLEKATQQMKKRVTTWQNKKCEILIHYQKLKVEFTSKKALIELSALDKAIHNQYVKFYKNVTAHLIVLKTPLEERHYNNIPIRCHRITYYF